MKLFELRDKLNELINEGHENKKVKFHTMWYEDSYSTDSY